MESSDAESLAALIGLPEPSDPPDGQLLARVRKTVRHYLTTHLGQILASVRERRPKGHINRFKPYLQQRFRVVVTRYMATLRAGTGAPEPSRPVPSPEGSPPGSCAVPTP